MQTNLGQGSWDERSTRFLVMGPHEVVFKLYAPLFSPDCSSGLVFPPPFPQIPPLPLLAFHKQATESAREVGWAGGLSAANRLHMLLYLSFPFGSCRLIQTIEAISEILQDFKYDSEEST